MFCNNPAIQLSETMNRLYAFRLTTTTGGNLSIRDKTGKLWVTPTGVDKANLTPGDILQIDTDGHVSGKHKPSIETGFHKGIYDARNDIDAVVHAHAPASSAFCIHNTVPDLRLIPQVYQMTGPAALSGYATPGTLWLRDNVVEQAKNNFNTILLDNHGAITTGKSLLEALQSFEGLDVCASAQILSKNLGSPVVPDSDTLGIVGKLTQSVFDPISDHKDFSKERKELCTMAKRAYERRLVTSSLGSLSMRVGKDEFLITPYGGDRYTLHEEEIVLIKHGGAESGKSPDLWTNVHRTIYQEHESISSVMTAMPASVMAYAITDTLFNSRSLTECYVVLRDLEKIDLQDALENPKNIASMISPARPVIMINHGGVLAVGQNLLEVLDRIEVSEVSMQATLWSQQLGNVVNLDEKKIKAIRDAFGF